MQKRNVRFITEIAIFSALGLVFDLLANFYSGYIWSQGGSISVVLVPIVLMAYRWGLKGGLLTGLLVGTIQIIWAGGGAVYPVQVLLDYVLAYTVIGLAGIFAKKIKKADSKQVRIFFTNLGVLIFGLARTIFHVISGVLFFTKPVSNSFKDILTATGYSSSYNFGFMIPTIIITMIVMTIIVEKQTHIIHID